MSRTRERHYYVLCAGLIGLVLVAPLAPALWRNLHIAWHLRGLDSSSAEIRIGALRGLRAFVSEGKLGPHRVARMIEDSDPDVRQLAAQVLMDSGEPRALSSAALVMPETYIPAQSPKSISPLPAMAPGQPITQISGSKMVLIGWSGGGSIGREDKWMIPALLAEDPDPEKLRRVITSVGKDANGIGFGRPGFGCCRIHRPIESSLRKGFKEASHPGSQLLVQTMLAVHRSCELVAEQIEAAEALPPAIDGDAAAPAVRFLKGRAFAPGRVLAALADPEDRIKCWGLLVACEKPRSGYRRAVERLVPYDGKKRPLYSVGILATRALGAIGNPRSLDLLRRTAIEGNYVQRSEAITALGRIRGSDPVPACLEVLSKPAKSIRDWRAACRVIGEHGDVDDIPALEAVLRADLEKKWVSWAVKDLRNRVREAIAAIRRRTRKT